MSPCTPHRWSKVFSFAPVHPINAGMGPFGEVNASCAQLCGAALHEQTEHGTNAASATSLNGSKMFLYSTVISIKGVV